MIHTFVILAYKNSSYLENCIQSIQKQSTPSFVYISTSTPSEYIHNISQKYNIPIFINETKKGIANDWNFSIKLAKTKYVTLAHQDDIYESEYVKKCLTASEYYSDTLICFTDYTELKNNIETSNNLLLIIKKIILTIFMPFKKYIHKIYLKKYFLSFGNPISCPSVMYNLSNINEIQFSEKYKTCLDWDAWLKLAQVNGRFVYVPTALMKHRIHENSATSQSIESSERQNEDFEMFSIIWPKPIAYFFSFIYSLSYLSNKTT